MANAVFPNVVDYNRCHEMAHQVLDDLICRGNRLARSRRAELRHLEDLCQELISRGHQQGLPTWQLLGPDPRGMKFGGTLSRTREGTVSDDNETQPLASSVDMNETMGIMPHAQQMSDEEFLINIGISSEEFLSIVQQMGGSDAFSGDMLTLD